MRFSSLNPGLWLQWVVVHALALGIGFPAGYKMLIAMMESIGELFFAYLLGVTVVGRCLGVLQWYVLRRWLSHPGLWILATIAGVGVGLFLAVLGVAASIMVVGPVLGPLLAMPEDSLDAPWIPVVGIFMPIIVYSVIASVSIGGMQWLVRDRGVSPDWGWVTAHAIAGAVAGVAFGTVFLLTPTGAPLAITSIAGDREALFLALAGAAVGAAGSAVTGSRLNWLFRFVET